VSARSDMVAVGDSCRTCNMSKNSTPVVRWLLSALTDQNPDERRQRIVERLRTGEIAECLGPPQPGWLWHGDDEGCEPPPSTLAQCIVEVAALDLADAQYAMRVKTAAVASLVGEDWLQTIGWWGQ